MTPTRSGLPLAALLLVACADAPLKAPIPPAVISPVVCANDVTVSVELGGERWTVGHLLAGAKIFVLSEEAEGYRTVQVHGGSIEIPNDVRLMAQDAQLAECPKEP